MFNMEYAILIVGLALFGVMALANKAQAQERYAYTHTHSIHEREVIAATLLLEAGGEGKKGIWAVANVIQNRVKRQKQRWGYSAYEVVTKPAQFSCFIKGEDSYDFVDRAKEKFMIEWLYAMDLANNLQEDTYMSDITRGATHYFNPALAAPSWARSPKMMKTLTLNHHVFYREMQS